jgi:hypothetical protein
MWSAYAASRPKEPCPRGISKLELLLLVLCTLEFSFFFDALFLHFTHGVLLSATALLAPVSSGLLIFYTLLKMPRSEPGPHAAPAVHSLHPQLHENA